MTYTISFRKYASLLHTTLGQKVDIQSVSSIRLPSNMVPCEVTHEVNTRRNYYSFLENGSSCEVYYVLEIRVQFQRLLLKA